MNTLRDLFTSTALSMIAAAYITSPTEFSSKKLVSNIQKKVSVDCMSLPGEGIKTFCDPFTSTASGMIATAFLFPSFGGLLIL